MSILRSSLYSVLLLATAAAHQVSSTPPQIAQESSNHLLEKEKRNKRRSDEKGKEALHEGRGISRGALFAIATTRVSFIVGQTVKLSDVCSPL